VTGPSRYRLTAAAETDLRRVLRASRVRFERAQALRYKALIDRAIAAVWDDPLRPASQARDELGPDVRTFHIGLIADRPRAARHLLVYRPAGDAPVEIIRVLHDSMDLARHLPGRDEQDEPPAEDRGRARSSRRER
jgi:toxin ParE1/3/4